MPAHSRLSYDARQVTSQSTQKVLQRGVIFAFDAVKALFSFMGALWKTFLSK